MPHVSVCACFHMYACTHVCMVTWACACVGVHAPRPCPHWGETEVPTGRLGAVLMSSDRQERKRRIYLMINKAAYREFWGLQYRGHDQKINLKLSAQMRKELPSTGSWKGPRCLRFSCCPHSGIWESTFLGYESRVTPQHPLPIG